MEEQTHVPEAAPKPAKDFSSFLLPNSPAMQELLKPVGRENPLVNDVKIRKLYLQASQQQWFAPKRINFELEIKLSPEERRVWIRLMHIFYTLEKMGLNVIANMMTKASHRLHSDEVALYLSAQCFDESRHVFAIENYLKKLGAPPRYDWKYHVLGQIASMGFYRVENWLFSTLFSENFASAFLRRARNANIDELGGEMCRNLLMDESRHLHFLHIVLPDILDRMSMFGRSYVKTSQFFIMKLTETWARTLDPDVDIVGLDRRSLLEEVFENVERAYAGFGVTRDYLRFPKIKN
jgi:P-aminobenzoate N-oxygenase AurF